MAIDLNKLRTKLDKALAEMTTESVDAWLKSKGYILDGKSTIYPCKIIRDKIDDILDLTDQACEVGLIDDRDRLYLKSIMIKAKIEYSKKFKVIVIE